MSAQKTIKRLVAFVIIANLVVIIVVFLGNPSPPRKPLPSPNGFDDFVKAGQLVSGTEGVSNSISQPDLQAIVARNAAALALVRQGLTNQSRVPNDYATNYFEHYQPAFNSFKQLALALSAEGKLAEIEHRTNDAARAYLQIVQLSQESTRGGILIWKLGGVACQTFGLRNLEPLTNRLDAVHSRETAKALETIDTQDESAEDVLKTEAAWVKETYGWRGQLQALLTRKMLNTAKTNFLNKYRGSQLQRRQLMVNFATRAYELDKGKPPGTSAELMPDYLKAIPLDPFTSTNLMLHP